MSTKPSENNSQNTLSDSPGTLKGLFLPGREHTHFTSLTIGEPPYAGCDEAGRGCLAGPVVAAAVILPYDFEHPLLNDSKQLSEKKRNTLRNVIESEATAWAVAMVHNTEIDQMNILNASIRAMHLAIDNLKTTPEALLIDGNRFHAYGDIPHACVIKGDGIFKCIAAASILAKTHRDDYMLKMHEKHPIYGWDRNKGYPTKTHRQGIETNGISPLHRKSFKLTEKQIKINFDECRGMH